MIQMINLLQWCSAGEAGVIKATRMQAMSSLQILRSIIHW